MARHSDWRASVALQVSADGVERLLTLGAYPDVTLKRARGWLELQSKSLPLAAAA